MKKIIFYCLTAGGFLMTACKKDIAFLTTPATTSPTIYQQLNPLAIDYVQLPVNRHFIYKDSATAATDSVIVAESYIVKLLSPSIAAGYYSPAVPAYFYDKYTLTLTKVGGTTNQTWFKGTASSLSTSYFGATSYGTNGILSGFSLRNEQTTLSAFWYPFTSTYGFYEYNFLPAMTIEGITYTAVHQFIINNGVQPSDASYLKNIYYWVKGIGIIKREISTSTSVKTSLLVRYGQ